MISASRTYDGGHFSDRLHGLHLNGVSGILADEMGLGKTVQARRDRVAQESLGEFDH
jgi:SNF2 family DNA or RNA helicase